MSCRWMRLPLFFKPVCLRDSVMVDGGLLSNFPVWFFDDGSQNPPWPTLGYRFVEPEAGRAREISSPLSLITACFNAMLESHDERHIREASFARTIPIPTLGINTTDFNIGQEQKTALFNSGYAAQSFFAKWDFGEYKAKYRLVRRS